jgi:hypothetical protein
MAREPYLVTVIKCLADLEAKDTLTPDEAYRLNGYRRWLGKHYPQVSSALATEYLYLSTHSKAG